jgi:hypothetical protein
MLIQLHLVTKSERLLLSAVDKAEIRDQTFHSELHLHHEQGGGSTQNSLSGLETIHQIKPGSYHLII